MTDTDATRGDLETEDLAAKLDALLRIRYGDDDQRAHRRSLAAQLLANELRRWQPSMKSTAGLDEVLDGARRLSSEALTQVRRRVLFYACDDLIALLVHKRIRGDAIAREEAVLYVQDRLQRDDFRRIELYQGNRGASFVTYMWQVVNNLLLDFLRAYGKQSERRSDIALDNAMSAHSLDDIDTNAERNVQAEQLRELLAETMSDVGDAERAHSMRARLRDYLQLTSRERVFLKAMFQYDMSVAEICALPGFDMSPAEAYRCYYGIMEKLIEAFKKAGLVNALHSMVSDAMPQTVVAIEGEVCRVAANRIFYLVHADRVSTDCHVRWRGSTRPGSIRDSFGKTFKRLSAFFSRIDSATALSDDVLAAMQPQWQVNGEVRIEGVARTFRIGARYLTELKRRFCGEKQSAALV